MKTIGVKKLEKEVLSFDKEKQVWNIKVEKPTIIYFYLGWMKEFPFYVLKEEKSESIHSMANYELKNQLNNLSEDMNSDVDLIYCNLENEPEFVQDYGFTEFPSCLLVDKNKLPSMISGAIYYKDIIEYFKTFIKE